MALGASQIFGTHPVVFTLKVLYSLKTFSEMRGPENVHKT